MIAVAIWIIGGMQPFLEGLKKEKDNGEIVKKMFRQVRPMLELIQNKK